MTTRSEDMPMWEDLEKARIACGASRVSTDLQT